MQISLDELKTNPDQYIMLAQDEDIYVTKDGRRVARITNARTDKIMAARSLFGLVANTNELPGEDVLP